MTKKTKNLQQKKDDAEMALMTAYMEKTADLIQNMPTFARDADENEWSSLNTGRRIYRESDIIEMQKTAYKMYYVDPSAKGLIDTMVNFVVGKDAHIIPVDERDEVDEYWKLFCKTNDFDMRMKELVKRCFRDGESFLRFFRPKTKLGTQLIRFVDPDQIVDTQGRYSFGIETARNDVETIIKYYLKKGRGVLARDMVHTKINVDSNVKRGMSFLVGIAKYIVKYSSWLDDRIMLNKVRSMFNMIVKVTGISPVAFSEKFANVTSKTIGSGTAKKQMPKPGSVLVATPGVEYKYENLNIHAQDTGKDGRLIELQVAKGTNLTEYVVRADSSNSNYSSTMVSESPMVRNFQAWQDGFEKPMKIIFAKVIEYGIKTRQIPRDSNTECTVNFAGLIHRDIDKETAAYVLQIINGIVSKRTISETLGYNWEEEQIQIIKELEEESDNEFNRRDENSEEDEQ